MSKKFLARDYQGLIDMAVSCAGMDAAGYIELYARRRRIVENRIATAFWALVAQGQIPTHEDSDGLTVIG